MKKIQTLFVRNDDHKVIDEVLAGSEWVAEGEGLATRKFDGTCCLIQNGLLYKRYDAKNGKTPPEGFIPAQEPDSNTGHWPGWLLVAGGPEDRWHLTALADPDLKLEDGTYELCGPKINGNPEKLDRHMLIRHGSETYPTFPRTYNAIREWFKEYPYIEGVVWHHRDGRMVKIKAKDFPK